MGFLIIILLGAGWGALWHYFIRREYWLVSVAAAIGAGGILVSGCILCGERVDIAEWFCVSSFVLPGALLGGIPIRLKFRPRPQTGVCRKCGYSLRGLPLPRCPECGLGFDPDETAPVIDERPASVLPLQVLFAIAFFVADGFICAAIMFAGPEKFFAREMLWLWAVLGLSCAAIPLAGRIRTRGGAMVFILVVLVAIAGLVLWFSRYA